ncbi:hypothetical protein HanHA300_Chr12g0432511 [Helianthus annuus]|uniref:Uncharacterized protein n=1 Tax=Helianthus annuus TaxID=4232 RepID=A0A251SZA5_HELAN|nr:hypothetical protein HanHA300_Chr12g0432511 [Helianthus annuus]KAJ0504243.1 hypothetical protein HanHA89_Chr12g0457151 [Helianthus annuus]KAJ0673950.1 hypothetical protein HanLR1_Chr12g0434621 [Helianthus annuus]
MNHEVQRIQLLELSGLFLAGLLQEDCYRRPLQTTSASNTTTTMFSPPQRYFYPQNSYLSILNRMLNKQKVIISSINYIIDMMK